MSLLCLLHKHPVLAIVCYIEIIRTHTMGCLSVWLLARQHAKLDPAVPSVGTVFFDAKVNKNNINFLLMETVV